MSKDPAILFYTSDFLSGTFTMSDEHAGMYIRLLCLQHQKGRLTEKDMLSICKASVPEVFEKFEKEDGKYYNIRLEEETIRRRNYTESRRNNGKKPKVSKKTGEAYAKHMETETVTETINKDIDKNKKPVFDFDKVWSSYPRREGKKQALIHFQAQIKSQEDYDNLIKAIENYKELKKDTEPQYLKMGSTFFNNWKDYIPEPEPPKPPKTQKEIDFENFMRNVEKDTGAR